MSTQEALRLCHKCQQTIKNSNRKVADLIPNEDPDKSESYETIPCCGWWETWDASECCNCGEIFFRKKRST